MYFIFLGAGKLLCLIISYRSSHCSVDGWLVELRQSWWSQVRECSLWSLTELQVFKACGCCIFLYFLWCFRHLGEHTITFHFWSFFAAFVCSNLKGSQQVVNNHPCFPFLVLILILCPLFHAGLNLHGPRSRSKWQDISTCPFVPV